MDGGLRLQRLPIHLFLCPFVFPFAFCLPTEREEEGREGGGKRRREEGRKGNSKRYHLFPFHSPSPPLPPFLPPSLHPYLHVVFSSHHLLPIKKEKS